MRAHLSYFMLATGLVAMPTAAQDTGLEPSVMQAEVLERGAIRFRQREAVNDWGTGAFRLTASRTRQGGKPLVVPLIAELWQRRVEVRLHTQQEVSPGISGAIDLSFTHIRSGRSAAPLLVQRSGLTMREAVLTLQGDNGAALALAAFARGGWEVGAVEALANRMGNGEQRAQRGVAVELASSRSQDRLHRIALRLERTHSTGLPVDTAVTLAMRWPL